MNWAGLSARIATETSPSRAGAEDAVTTVFSTIDDVLASGEIDRIADFATFLMRSRPEASEFSASAMHVVNHHTRGLRMMSRLWIIAFLGLHPVLALAEEKSESACKITTELETGAELKTIHENVLCLHRRLNAIEAAAKLRKKDQSAYIPIQDTTEPPINTCGNAAICMNYISEFVHDFCGNGCSNDLDHWREDMTPEWKQFFDKGTYDYEFNRDGLKDILNQGRLFGSGEAGQRLDMKRFFEDVSPSEFLSPVQTLAQ